MTVSGPHDILDVQLISKILPGLPYSDLFNKKWRSRDEKRGLVGRSRSLLVCDILSPQKYVTHSCFFVSLWCAPVTMSEWLHQNHNIAKKCGWTKYPKNLKIAKLYWKKAKKWAYLEPEKNFTTFSLPQNYVWTTWFMDEPLHISAAQLESIQFNYLLPEFLEKVVSCSSFHLHHIFDLSVESSFSLWLSPIR